MIKDDINEPINKRPLNEEEIEELPKDEKRKYLTKIMFQEMLKNLNKQRSTTSPGQAISNSSQVKPLLRALDPSQKLAFKREEERKAAEI